MDSAPVNPSPAQGSVIVQHFFYHFAWETVGGGASYTDYAGEFNEALYLERY